MYALNVTENPAPSDPITFEPTDEAARNERDLYVLQEIYNYLPKLLQDFLYLQNGHVTTPPPPTTPTPTPYEELLMEYDMLIEETRVLAEYAGDVYMDYVSSKHRYILDVHDVK